VETAVSQTTEETPSAAAVQSNKLSQKDAVFNFLMDALDTSQNPLTSGQTLKTRVTKDIRKVVRQRLFNEIKAGNVKLSKTMDDSKLKKYCSGLINNWLKKDERFN
jgi:hypothetical protein